MTIMFPKKAARLILLLILIFHMNSGCAVNTLHAEETKKSTRNEAHEVQSQYSKETKSIDGIAVYYEKKYQGRKTNSGERFDHNKLTAAHPSLPHGTRVKVINIANNKSVVVTINDRCRKRKYEIIDLTRKAAQELGFYGKDCAKVKIIPLSER